MAAAEFRLLVTVTEVELIVTGAVVVSITALTGKPPAEPPTLRAISPSGNGRNGAAVENSWLIEDCPQTC